VSCFCRICCVFQVYSWGNGEFGRCGNGKSQQPVPEPVDVLSSQKCTAVSAGQQFSTAVTASGDLWVWGKNDQAQLGLGGNLAMDINTMEEYPLKIEKLSECLRAFLPHIRACQVVRGVP
jgi:alpha-tubulin suppressor-like RCC1 family protein